jgi:hypothetical protein
MITEQITIGYSSIDEKSSTKRLAESSAVKFVFTI